MSRRKMWAMGVVGLVSAVIWALTVSTGDAATTFRFVEVTRGDVESTVTATGTVQATETVEVGTQVSGQIAEIYVDFNDRVEEGQLIARIDPTLLEQEVRSAEVALARNQADLDQARRELDRFRDLHASEVVSVSELDLAQYQFNLAEAAYRSAEISLERAQRNLQYTEIRAPIDGVVISRAVEVGQTVAASLSAPVLFVIAHDLGQMEILASVDESDIGRIAEGQPVRFSVQAYVEKAFVGTVRQVRLEAKTQENVVTYSVVVAVDNEDGSLLPGMTATLDIVLERAEDVLTVPNAALRFTATEQMLQEVAGSREAAGDRREGAAIGGRAGAGSQGRRPDRGQASPSAEQGGFATLWHLDDEGETTMSRIRTGLSDGTRTVIVDAPDEVYEGLQIIAAITTEAQAAATENPFQAQQQSGGPPRRPGGF